MYKFLQFLYKCAYIVMSTRWQSCILVHIQTNISLIKISAGSLNLRNDGLYETYNPIHHFKLNIF